MSGGKNKVPSRGMTTKAPLLEEPFSHLDAVGGTAHFEESPAYNVLRQHALLTTKYRLADASELDARKANSSPGELVALGAASCLVPLLGPVLWGCTTTRFSVPAGHVGLLEDGRGGFEFAAEGVHCIKDPFYKFKGTVPIKGKKQHGDRALVVIEQGEIGFAMDCGQPVLLPPGLHQWRSPTLRFEQSLDMNSAVLKLGPYTLITVDEGYSAVTQDNGRQKILDGGSVYLLTHRNAKFEKFVSEKIQTNALTKIEATTADNILLSVESTVTWRIADVAVAARMAAETMNKDGADAKGSGTDITKLRQDVLKQAEASLAAFIGSMNYSDSMHVSAKNASAASASTTVVAPGDLIAYSPIYDTARLTSAVQHANDTTAKYGVEIISINVISASPTDQQLRTSLARGAVAVAEAQQAETAAHGNAKAALINAEGHARAAVAQAKGDADAERIRAEGALQAAEKLGSNQIAVDLAKLDRTGAALSAGGSKSFFFGAEPGSLGALLAPAAANVATSN